MKFKKSYLTRVVTSRIPKILIEVREIRLHNKMKYLV